MATLVGYGGGGIAGAYIGAVLAPFTFGASIAAGAAFGATVGGFAGGVAGAYVDSTYTFPLIFGGPPRTSSGKIDDLKIQSGSEGTPINFCLGPINRVAGNVIWTTKLLEVRVSSGKGGGKGGGNTQYGYHVSCAVGVCEGPINRIVRIWADQKVIYDVASKGVYDRQRVSSITVYPGNDTQTADPTMESYLGSGNVPAYRRRCYVVFENLHLGDFGNRIPQFNFLVEQVPSLSVGDAIGTLLQRAGLETDDYDVSTVTGCFNGITLSGPHSIGQDLAPVLGAYSLRVRETPTLVFFPIGSEGSATLVEQNLAASTDPRGTILWEITDTPDSEIPNRVVVTYVEKNSQSQRGSLSVVKGGSDPDNVQTVDIPFVLIGTEASQVANKALWTGWIEREKVHAFLPPSCLCVQETDILNVSVRGNQYAMRVTEVTRGANFIHDIQGVIVSKTINTSTLESADVQDAESGTAPAAPPPIEQSAPSGDPVFSGGGDVPDPNNPLPGVDSVPDPSTTTGTTLIAESPSDYLVALADIPPLTNEDENSIGIYHAMVQTDGTTWFGAILDRSDDDVSYTQIGADAIAGLIGSSLDVLSDGPVGYWDHVNTIDVYFFVDPELSTMTEAEVLSGANMIKIGDEILAFKTATLISANTYTLSNLLRGLRNTEAATSTHEGGEDVILLDPSRLSFSNMPLTAFNRTQYFKGVLNGQTPDDSDPTTITFQAQSIKPFSPCHLGAYKDSGGNVLLYWMRRTRAPQNPLSTSGVPLLETAEQYQVDIYSGSDVVRTATVSSPRFYYSAAAQVADGFSAGSAVHYIVYQMSSLIGRGNPAEATLTPVLWPFTFEATDTDLPANPALAAVWVFDPTTGQAKWLAPTSSAADKTLEYKHVDNEMELV